MTASGAALRTYAFVRKGIFAQVGTDLLDQGHPSERIASVERSEQIFIVTRFNVVYSEAHFAMDKAGNPTRTGAWLTKRFALFEQICLPSLKAQTDQRFTWLVFFSDGTPERYKARIEEIHAGFPSFVPVYLRDGEYLVGRFQQEVRERLEPGITHAITLRIDNDDAFHRTMVEHVRQEFNGQEDEVLNFVHGLQCDLDHGVVAIAAELNNPFISRIERVRPDGVQTAIGMMHFEASATGVLRDIRTTPLWLQAIHGGNVTNRLDSGRYLFRVDLLGDFGITYPFQLNRLRTMCWWLGNLVWRRPQRVVRGALRFTRRLINA